MMKLKEALLKLMYKNSKGICFPLHGKSDKPVFISEACKTNDKFTCMLDTGAAIPVWCSGVAQLVDAFPSAVYKLDLKTILSGFGTGFQVAGVYYIPEIEFNNGDGNSLRFTKFYLPVVERRTFGADLIFPSAMLKETNILLCDSDGNGLEKSLFLQNSSLLYKASYTYRQLPVSTVNKIKEVCKSQGISIHTKFIGSGNEFYKILVQNGSENCTEVFSKEMEAF